MSEHIPATLESLHRLPSSGRPTKNLSASQRYGEYSSDTYIPLSTGGERLHVEPTNNTAEQAVRQAVLWRKGSFGSQSNGGSRYVERMLTGVETTRRQGRNFFVFLTATIVAAVAGLPSPSLLPGVEYVQPQPPQAGTCSINPAPDAKPAPEQPSITVMVDSS